MKMSVVTIVFALMLSSAAMAEGEAREPRETQAEQISRMMLQFSADGVLNDDRRKAPIARHTVSTWAEKMRSLLRHDANGDGALSAAEIAVARKVAAATEKAGIDHMVYQGDANADGTLSWDELSHVARQTVLERDDCAPTCSNLISLWMSI